MDLPFYASSNRIESLLIRLLALGGTRYLLRAGTQARNGIAQPPQTESYEERHLPQNTHNPLPV